MPEFDKPVVAWATPWAIWSMNGSTVAVALAAPRPVALALAATLIVPVLLIESPATPAAPVATADWNRPWATLATAAAWIAESARAPAENARVPLLLRVAFAVLVADADWLTP